MKFLTSQILLLLFCSIATAALAEENIRLETTIIKNNTELPQVIYIVPWRDMKEEKRKEQTLTLHSLYGNLFDPVYPADSAGYRH
jgi:hypothetical protein